MRKIDYTIDNEHDGSRVDKFLRSNGYSRGVITELKYNDGLFLNGEKVRTVDTLKSGDILTICMNDYSVTVPNPLLSAVIAYEDDVVVIFDKPYNMPSHQSVGHYGDTLANLFAARYPGVMFRSVNRLDKNTSGLITIAKNKFSASKLMSDERYRPEKKYYALTAGGFADKNGEEGEIIAPIGREDDTLIRRCVREDGAYAHTKYKVLKSSDEYTLFEVTLVTGRTHQIRVHFSYIGFPLLGDDMYGGNRRLIKRQALHCGYIRFRHPVTDEEHIVTSPLPEDMERIVENEKVPTDILL